jgi:hypothetical protein
MSREGIAAEAASDECEAVEERIHIAERVQTSDESRVSGSERSERSER